MDDQSLIPDPEKPTNPLFDWVPDQVLRPPLPNNPEVMDNTKMLGALATQRQADDSLTLEQALNRVSTAFDNGAEPQVRQGIAARKAQVEGDYLKQIQGELLGSAEIPELNTPSLINLMQKEKDVRESRDPYALEKEGVSQLQETGSDDDQQALTLQRQLNESPGALDLVNDQTYKMVRIHQEVDKLEKMNKDQGAAKSVWDWLRVALVPLSDFAAKFGTGKTDYSTIGNLVDPGGAFQQSAEKLMGASKEEFDKQLPKFVDQLLGKTDSFFSNPKQAAEILSKVPGFTDNDALDTNIQAANDVFTLGTIGQVGKGILRVATMTGNRAGAANAAAGAIVKDAAGATSKVSPVEAVAEALPSAQTPGGRSYVGVSGNVVDKLETMDLIAQQAQDLPRVSRIEDAQLQPNIQETIRNLLNRFRGNMVIDTKLAAGEVGPGLPYEITKDRTTALTKVNMYLGNQWGTGGFVTEEGATASLARRGLSPEDAKIIQLRDGQYYIKYSADVPETGVAAPFVKREQVPNSGEVKSRMSNMSNLMPDYFNNERVKSVWQRSGLQKDVYDPISKNITKLNSSELQDLRKVLAVGRDERHPTTGNMGRWFKPDELTAQYERVTGRTPTDREVTAYYAYRQLNDVNHQLLNDEVYIQNARRGVVTARVQNSNTGFDTGRRNAVEVLEPKWGELQHLYDADEGAFYTGEGVLPEKPLSYEERLGLETRGIIRKEEGLSYEEAQAQTFDSARKKFESGHYRILEFHGNDIEFEGTPVKHVLVSKRSSTVGPLEREQLAYLEGGPVEYASRWFLKQANTTTVKGKTFVRGSRTIMTAHTRSELQEVADNMNDAVNKYKAWQAGEYDKPTGWNSKSYEDWAARQAETKPAGWTYQDVRGIPTEVVAAIEKTGYENVGKFEQALKDGEFQLDHPMEVTFDRQQPQAVSKLGEHNRFVDVRDKDPDNTLDYLLSRGRLYYSKRGDRLPSPGGAKADIVDPFRTLSNAMKYAGNTRALADYNKLVTDEWARLAEPYLMPGSYSRGGGPSDMFFNGKFDPNLAKSDPQLLMQLETMRGQHKAFMNHKDIEVTSWELNSRRLADYIESKGLQNTKVGNFVYKKALDKYSTNPADAVRGMVFDPYLGFYDPGQFFLQSQTAFAAMTIEPKFGIQAAVMTKPLMHVLINRSENLLDYYATRLTSLHGMGPKEFKQMVQFVREWGIDKIGGEMAQIDRYVNSWGGSMLVKGGRAVLKGGRIPFEIGNKINRLTALQIGWRVVRRDFPELEVGSEKFLSKVAGTTDDLDMNMTRASTAAWQRGWFGASIARFQTYNAHLLEALLPKSFGGNPRFSAQQRARLAIGQGMMYGTKGVLGGGILAAGIEQGYKAATGQDITPEWQRVLTKGLFDTLFYQAGADTDFSSRAAVPAAFADWVQRAANGDMASFLDFLGGPSAQWGSNLFDSANRLALYFKAEQTGQLGTQDFEEVANEVGQQIASTKRFTKAYWIWKLGYIRDPQTHNAVASATAMDGLAALLGIPLRRDINRFEIVRDAKAREAMIDDIAKILVQKQRDMLYEAGGIDPQHVDRDREAFHSKVIAGIMQVYRDDPLLQDAIVKRKNQLSNLPVTEWERLLNNMSKTTGQSPDVYGGR